MNKFGRLAIFVVLLYVVQSSLLTLIAYRGIGPDLMLLLTVSYAFLRGMRYGGLMGFATGLLQDLAMGTFLGVHAFSQLLIGMFFGRFSDRVFKEQFFLPVGQIFLQLILAALVRPPGMLIVNFLHRPPKCLIPAVCNPTGPCAGMRRLEFSQDFLIKFLIPGKCHVYDLISFPNQEIFNLRFCK